MSVQSLSVKICKTTGGGGGGGGGGGIHPDGSQGVAMTVQSLSMKICKTAREGVGEGGSVHRSCHKSRFISNQK